MAVKFFCDRCGKEVWQGVHRSKENLIEAIKSMYEEHDCYCTDCIMTRLNILENVLKEDLGTLELNQIICRIQQSLKNSGYKAATAYLPQRYMKT